MKLLSFTCCSFDQTPYHKHSHYCTEALALTPRLQTHPRLARTPTAPVCKLRLLHMKGTSSYLGDYDFSTMFVGFPVPQ